MLGSLWRYLASTLLTVFFSETMLLPAIPEIIKDFNISYGTAPWIFSAYLIVAAVMTPVAGRLSDLYGKKKILLTLLIIYIAGLAAGGFADNISFLLATRLIQGVGLAAVPAAFSLVRDTFPPGQACYGYRGVWLRVLCGLGSRPLGWSQHHPELRMACNILDYSSFCALVTLMITKFVKEKTELDQSITAKAPERTSNKKRASFSIDIKGVVALSATITSFLIALTLIQIGVSSEICSDRKQHSWHQQFHYLSLSSSRKRSYSLFLTLGF